VRKLLKAEILLMAMVFFCLASAQSQGQQPQSQGQQPQSQGHASQSPKNSSPVHTAASSSEGEKRFQENCGRCHQAPQELSPREVKAVIRHMRVRAMLSAEDEQLILKYLAP
jgi:cytochrome c5